MHKGDYILGYLRCLIRERRDIKRQKIKTRGTPKAISESIMDQLS